MLLSIFELCANRCRRGNFALIGVSENEFTHLPWYCYYILKIKNALIKYLYYVTKCAILNLISHII